MLFFDNRQSVTEVSLEYYKYVCVCTCMYVSLCNTELLYACMWSRLSNKIEGVWWLYSLRDVVSTPIPLADKIWTVTENSKHSHGDFHIHKWH